MPAILVVDDEATLAQLLAAALRYEGWEVATAADGYEALRVFDAGQFDAVVLDVMMPNLDGMQTLARLRTRDPALPVLFLTARDAVADRVAGLRAGADDYVTKPFDLDEVVARIEALLRRAGRAPGADASLIVGELRLETDSREVFVDGQLLTLTHTEFELLRYLMVNEGIVVSKAQILDAVWEYDFGGSGNIVELYISYLRKKLASHDSYIRTVRGAGYMLRAPR